MTARIVIDPNVRIRGNQTYSGFKDVQGPIAVGDKALAVEAEDGIVTDAEVTDIDEEKRIVYLAVDWRGWRDDDPGAAP
jgi:uncharacterized Rossmann fold enzyme